MNESDSREIAPGVRIGDVIGGKYRVDRILGEGGMGVVAAGHHLHLDEKCALKFLKEDALSSPETVARFVREARAAVKFKSEHVARVTDVGTLDNDAPFMVMEYLEGGDLEGWIEKRGALSVPQAVDFVLQASIAVADAHALGIVHRDLKPANLFCVRRSDGQLTIKVLDFGISKVTSAAAASITQTSTVMGTPLYMAPEQVVSAKRVDARTDIWALGVILYELITGSVPFVGETAMELAVKIANETPASLRTFRQDLPDGLDAVVLRCLEKVPDRRYANVAELAIALMPFGSTAARQSVERVRGIIESAGLSSGAIDAPLSPVPPATVSGPGLVDPGIATTVAIATTAATAAIATTGPSKPRPAVVGGAVVAVVSVFAVALIYLHGPSATVSSASAAPVGVAAPTRQPPEPQAAAPPSPPSEPPAMPPPTSTPSASPPPPRVSATARPKSSTATSAPPAAPRCDPPTWTDDKGHVHLKPGCQ